MAGLAAFSASRELILALQPETSLPRVRSMQAATAEAVRLLASRPSLTIGGAKDVRPLASRAKLGAILQPPDFLDILATIDSARILHDLLHRGQLVYPELATYAGRLHGFRGLREDIAATINDHGEVVDDASPQLVHLRREVRTGRDRIMRRLEAIIGDPNNAEAIQEPIVTERNGRYVIAVKAGFRHRIRGVVHDQSESGATLFVEPLVTVDMTNDWRQSQLDEQKEVERILRVLSGRVALEAAELDDVVQALASIDAVFAKAHFAQRLEAVEPDLNADGIVDLIDARHPLLSGKVVPQTIRLGEEYRALIITGPNTGGKTVALKTVGLLTLMAQCGLRIPAASGSKVAVFEEVLADIGDEQSIEQSLSTFSGHLRNIVDMLKTAGRESLVLLDELGAGTDPDEGSELARAILEYLLAHDVTTIATTHYSELKTFAHNREGVQNASVEFDVNSLSPTYRLRIGTPGRSNALAIAARLGLSDEIVASARGGLSEEHLKTENLLEEISRKERVAARERNRATREQRELRRLRAQAGEALDEAQRVRQEARENAYTEAEAELAELRREAARLAQQIDRARSDRQSVDSLRQQLVQARQDQNRDLATSLQKQLTEAVRSPLPNRDAQARAQSPLPLGQGQGEGSLSGDNMQQDEAKSRSLLALETQLADVLPRLDDESVDWLRGQLASMVDRHSRQAVQQARAGLSTAGQQLEKRRPRREAAQPLVSITVGQFVRVPSFTEAGQVLTLPDAKGETEVQVGAFRVRVRASELQRAPKPRQYEPAVAFERAPISTSGPRHSLSHPVDMRGLRADEVEDLLERELNQAFSSHVPYLKIIHGHGSGVVRRMVRDYLAQQPYVSSFEPASPGDGGDGATIVTLAV